MLTRIIITAGRRHHINQLRSCRSLLVAVCALTLAATPAFSKDDTTQAADNSKKEATSLLNQMAKYLAGLGNFSYKVNAGYDVVQADGQKIEFLESRDIVINRPNHVRGDFVQSDGSAGTLLLAGNTITLYNKTDHAYATAKTPPGFDAAVETVTGKFGIRMPLSMLLNPKLPEILGKKLQSADIVDTGTLHGVMCTHVVARGPEADAQIWIESGDRPVPHRVIITYRKENGSPQYRADIYEWKILPSPAPELFQFKIPDGAEKLEFHEGRKPSADTTKGERK